LFLIKEENSEQVFRSRKNPSPAVFLPELNRLSVPTINAFTVAAQQSGKRNGPNAECG
jgi:hypothetical protein